MHQWVGHGEKYFIMILMLAIMVPIFLNFPRVQENAISDQSMPLVKYDTFNRLPRKTSMMLLLNKNEPVGFKR